MLCFDNAMAKLACRCDSVSIAVTGLAGATWIADCAGDDCLMLAD